MVASEASSFGALLKTYRAAARLSQEELAARAGLSRRGISDLERGARTAPQRETTRRLIDALSLSEPQRSHLLAAAREAHFVDESEPRITLHLPRLLTSFVGRERIVAELLAALKDHRLVTVTGAGGIGKTRVALEVARHTAADYADGVGFIDLSPITNGSQVQLSVARAIGIRERPGRPLGDTLIDALRDRHALLVFDNCEHVVEASATLLHQLLPACPALGVLATSREPMGMIGEMRWVLPPMQLPAAGETASLDFDATEAMLLFRDRARAQDRSFQLSIDNLESVAEIGRSVDGLPLAIELAASWVSRLPVDEIARRLHDQLPLLIRGNRAAQPRQQTLRGTLDWSHALLSAEDAVLFRTLAVFAGGWTLEAAEAVCGGDAGPVGDLLASLGRLVDKSLVQAEPVGQGMRYRFLESIRQYARDKLRSSGDIDRVAAHHAAYFVDLAARATSELANAPVAGRQVELDSEHDNLRVSVRWVIGERDLRAAELLGTALGRFSQVGSHLSEGRAWLEELLAMFPEPCVGRAGIVISAGLLGAYQGEYTFAAARLLEGIGICRAVGEDRELAHGLFALGLMAWTRGDFDAARRCGEEGLVVSRRVGHRGFEALHLFIAAAAAADAGNRDAARVLADRSCSLGAEIRFGRAVGLSLGVLGLVAYLDADYTLAESRLSEAAEQLRAAGIPLAVAWVTSLRSRVAAAEQEYARARKLSGDALRVVKSFNLKGRAPFVVEGLAGVLAHDSEAESAVLLAGATYGLRQRMGLRAPPEDAVRLQQWLQPARAALGPAADRAWASGQRMSFEQTIETALDLSDAEVSRLLEARAGIDPPVREG